MTNMAITQSYEYLRNGMKSGINLQVSQKLKCNIFLVKECNVAWIPTYFETIELWNDFKSK